MLLRMMLASMVALLAAACASDGPTSPAPTSTPPPVADATPTPFPTPTPVDDTAARQAASALDRFGSEATVIAADWGTFRAGFDDWRGSLDACGEADRRADLRSWVVDFGVVTLAAASLDFPSGTAAARDSLTSAITLEEQGLRDLRDGWTPGSDAAFALYERSRTQALIGRQEARARIVELIAIVESGEPLPEPTAVPPQPGIPPGFLPPEPPPAPLAGAGELGEFKDALEASWVSWDAFHRRFDDWRRSDGDCAQAEVRGRLAAFARDFEAVLGRVNAQVRPSVVRPLAEQLIDAAVRESQGLADLRDSWTAYDAGPWRAFDAARRSADGLRRQVRSSLDELNLQYGINSAS